MKTRSLTKDYVDSLVSYNKETGDFTWLVSRGSVKEGRVAGTISVGRYRPYRMIKIDRKFYYAHKLAWLIEYNEWPESLDHINGDSLDNRLCNLRTCNMSQNKANSRKYKNNRSGSKGVFKVGDKYRVSIQKDGKRINLGRFTSLLEASEAYERAAKKYFGEFARAA